MRSRATYFAPCLVSALILFSVYHCFAQSSVPIDAPSSTKATPNDMVDALHSAFGNHHVRAVHAKGVILTGDFVPSPQARSITKAKQFQSGKIPVTFRFSDFTGIPDISDLDGNGMPRGMAVRFHLANEMYSDIVCHSFNGFPVPTTDDFRDFLMAIGKSSPDSPHPNAIERYLEAHPVAKTFVTTQKPPSESYVTLSYFGVNAFKFTNLKGNTRFIRYQLIPDAGEHFLTKEDLAKAGPNYLSEEIKERISKGVAGFKLYAQVAEKGDKIEDPSSVWPKERKLVLLGSFTIREYGDNSDQAHKKLAFNPGNVVDGINSADPMVTDRKGAYPVSFDQRQ